MPSFPAAVILSIVSGQFFKRCDTAFFLICGRRQFFDHFFDLIIELPCFAKPLHAGSHERTDYR